MNPKTEGPSGSLPSYKQLEKDHAYLYAEYRKVTKELQGLRDQLTDGYIHVDSLFERVMKEQEAAKIEASEVITRLLEGTYVPDA